MSGMNSIGEPFIRRIVREELHTYMTMLLECMAETETTSAARKHIKYQEFLDRVLLDDDSKAKTD